MSHDVSEPHLVPSAPQSSPAHVLLHRFVYQCCDADGRLTCAASFRVAFLYRRNTNQKYLKELCFLIPPFAVNLVHLASKYVPIGLCTPYILHRAFPDPCGVCRCAWNIHAHKFINDQGQYVAVHSNGIEHTSAGREGYMMTSYRL